MTKTRTRQRSLRVLDGLDHRTFEYKALRAWYEALVKDLGGEKTLTFMQQELLETAVQLKVEATKATARPVVRKSLLDVLRALFEASKGRTPASEGQNKRPSLEEIRARYTGSKPKKARQPA